MDSLHLSVSRIVVPHLKDIAPDKNFYNPHLLNL